MVYIFINQINHSNYLGGETVRALQEQSGARVKIDPTNDPNSEERTVNISGDPKCVAIAKQLVEDKVSEVSIQMKSVKQI